MTPSPDRRVTWSGNNLLARREDLQLSIADVAERSGLAVTTYWRAENGCEPKLSTAKAIAKVLGASVEQLWPND